jgi:hypothetical protein
MKQKSPGKAKAGRRPSKAVKIDRFTHLEEVARYLGKIQEDKKQNGPVKIIVKDGVPQL